ncbi:MAG: FKBP-type peptidyl-prolyl cis-trans isomerase [Pirellulaceae bacterium]
MSRRRSLITAVLLFFAGLIGYAVGMAQELAPPAARAPRSLPQMKTLADQASYSIGLDIGRGIQKDKLELNADLVARGLIDALTGAKPLLTDEQIQQVMTEFSRARRAKTAAGDPVSATNLKEGLDFLAANTVKKGITTTPTGLQYQVLATGKGSSPKETDIVRVHYHGTLLDGKVFDSSVERKEPSEFPVNRVIPAWTEALQKMKVGDKWRLFVPSELAYGESGFPDSPIGPNAMLIFDVELLEILQ